MKEYWQALDRACVELRCHSGGFYAVHKIYTPRFIEECRSGSCRPEPRRTT